ncbi:hypothetical protein AMIS_73230 [Actinoplanes missouriensis 431]|uniref:Uncharacterized protein n=1 Tax=Actinoplanes missouriensis (strain ATCC 14538 / DSM 43046 / CBS 188.64 / JCM 3121 / NBRC 102363 / NCIMB 12654 / NRRL B-3342 / UNCC 431) TaxID=512565 RepID=I0HHQ6_ACTM4|nr:hypothetical protein AMIS_73230 [Actinoplanes missouriensis 431]
MCVRRCGWIRLRGVKPEETLVEQLCSLLSCYNEVAGHLRGAHGVALSESGTLDRRGVFAGHLR